jgi:hypothetical protein
MNGGKGFSKVALGSINVSAPTPGFGAAPTRFE